MPELDGTPETGPVTDEDLVASIVTEDVAEEAVEAAEEVSEEVVEDDAEEASEGDDAEEDAEEVEDETEDSLTFTVKVSGEEFEVTQDELVAGYQKGADYHRKTAALAEERRSFQVQAQAEMAQMRSQYAAALDKIAQDEMKEPDWVSLSDKLDPWEYQKAQAEWGQKVQQRQQAQAQAEQIRTQDHQMIVAEQTQKLLESFPEWKTPEVFEAARAELLTTALGVGFTQDEFNNAVDHRVFKLAQKAAKWDKHQASLVKPVRKVPKKATKVLSPGASVTKAERRTANKASLRDNLRRKGDEDSAVAWLLGGN